jgi:hypothetical protein
VADLDGRGARRGGDRRTPDLFAPPPRYRLAAEIADRLEAAGAPMGSAERGALHDLTLRALTLAGEDEPERGLPDVLRDVLRARRDRADSGPVGPSRAAAA